MSGNIHEFVGKDGVTYQVDLDDRRHPNKGELAEPYVIAIPVVIKGTKGVSVKRIPLSGAITLVGAIPLRQ